MKVLFPSLRMRIQIQMHLQIRMLMACTNDSSRTFHHVIDCCWQFLSESSTWFETVVFHIPHSHLHLDAFIQSLWLISIFFFLICTFIHIHKQDDRTSESSMSKFFKSISFIAKYHKQFMDLQLFLQHRVSMVIMQWYKKIMFYNLMLNTITTRWF